MATTEWVEVKTRVPAELHQRFVQVLPMHGALSWAVREALSIIVSEYENEPLLTERLQRAISSTGRNA